MSKETNFREISNSSLKKEKVLLLFRTKSGGAIEPLVPLVPTALCWAGEIKFRGAIATLYFPFDVAELTLLLSISLV